MNKGKLIVLESGEGGGKSTNRKNLIAKLNGRSDVVFTQEPGGTEIGLVIREILLNKKNSGKISPLTELFLFCADRANHCDQIIRPALKEGKIVVSDRFDMSTIAYQIYGRQHEEYEKIFSQINSYAKGQEIYGEIKPDLVIYLDIDPKIGLARVNTRGDEITRFEKNEIDFHNRVREGYLKQAKSQKNWKIVDASQPEEKVKEEVWNIVKSFLKI